MQAVISFSQYRSYCSKIKILHVAFTKHSISLFYSEKISIHQLFILDINNIFLSWDVFSKFWSYGNLLVKSTDCDLKMYLNFSWHLLPCPLISAAKDTGESRRNENVFLSLKSISCIFYFTLWCKMQCSIVPRK